MALDKEAARPPGISPQNMSEIIVFLMALGSYHQLVGDDDPHLQVGSRLVRRYQKLMDQGFDKYIEPLIEGESVFGRFRAPLSKTKIGTYDQRALNRFELLQDLLPLLRVRRHMVETAFSDKRAVNTVMRTALASDEADPKSLLRKLTTVPTASKMQVARSWTRKAASLAGADPEIAESVLSDAETSREVGEDLRQINAAITQVDPMSERGADLQLQRQEIIDRIDEVAATSQSPATVFTTAATQAAAEPRVYRTRTGADRDLNPDKEDAMMIRGRGVIAAGAGAGKTLTLASKVVYHINELGVPPSSVVATSFSQKSAAELRKRIEKYGVTFGNRQDRGLGTTHSVAAKLMVDYFPQSRKQGVPKSKVSELVRLAMQQVKMGDGSIPVPPPAPILSTKKVQPEPEPEPEAEPNLSFSEAMRMAYDRKGSLRTSFLRNFISGFFERGQWYSRNMYVTGNLTSPRGLSYKQKNILNDIFTYTQVPYRIGSGRSAAEKKDKDKGLREKYYYFSTPAKKWFNLGEPLTDDKDPIPVGNFIAEISRLKGRLISPTEAWHSGKVDKRYAAVYAAYEWLKSPNGEAEFADQNDFTDVLIETSRLMLRYPEARAAIQNKYRVILVDEAQDLNRTQHVMFGLMAGYLDPEKLDRAGTASSIAELARDDGQMTADTYVFIGDDKQAIYEFRGADPDAFIDMSDLVEGGAGFSTHVLETNYRSGKNIVEAAMRLIAHNTRQIPMVCVANPERVDQGGAHVISFPPAARRDYQAAAEWVADHIQEQVALGIEQEDGGRSYSSFGVGLRTNAEAYSYGMALIERGIPFRSRVNFFQDSSSKALIGWLTIADEGVSGDTQKINDAVLAVMNTPVNKLGKKFRKELSEKATGNYITWLEMYGDSIYGPRSQWTQHVDRFTSNLMKIADLKGQNLSGEVILNTILELQGFDGTGIQDALVDRILADEAKMAELRAESPDGSVDQDALIEEALAPINPLIGLLRSRADLTSSLVYLDQLKQASATLALSDDPNKGDADVPAVTLGTMHSWKGLEVPTMYVPMVGGSFPRFDKTTEEDLASERRLAYVAITRAEDDVYVLDCPTAITRKEGVVIQRSQFVDELCVPEQSSEGRVASAIDLMAPDPAEQELAEEINAEELADMSNLIDAEIDAYLAEEEGRGLMASWGGLLYTGGE